MGGSTCGTGALGVGLVGGVRREMGTSRAALTSVMATAQRAVEPPDVRRASPTQVDESGDLEHTLKGSDGDEISRRTRGSRWVSMLAVGSDASVTREMRLMSRQAGVCLAPGRPKAALILTGEEREWLLRLT
jgi:hypothetical protein